MFRNSAGYRAHFQGFDLTVAPDFDEWRIFVQSPDVIIHGGRQFTEAKAKEFALAIAQSYLRDERHEALPDGLPVEWAPLGAGAWLNWRP